MRNATILPVLLLAAATQAVEFYPVIPNSYIGTNTLLVTGITDKLGNNVTASMYMNSGSMFVNAFAPNNNFATNINGAAIFNNVPGDVANFSFSSTITGFYMNFVADGYTGSSSMIVYGFLNGVQVGAGQVFGSSNPLHYDEGQIHYLAAGGIDSLTIQLLGHPSVMDLWALGTDVAGTGSFGLNGGAVPEPSTYGLALGGLALAVVAARRRSKSSK